MAESLMTDTFRVVRHTGRTVTDPDTGLTTPATLTVYEGNGKLQTSGGVASDKVSATGETSNVGGNVAEWGLYLHVPIAVANLREKDVAECVSSSDPMLVGRRYRLVNLQSEKTHATARRWNVREIPEGA
ncbi:phage associated protein [Bifidobacterium parmae]|uniref:Phage associated protein n=2 Tax=Bifidobacterium parmae TaxID=361854 RepID=A0A2N5IVJ6_9BIFI|nr:phage associated protein [Bifidobacterium parmae]